MKSWLQGNTIENYSTHNEEKCVIGKRFFRTLKNKIYKHMTSISNNASIDKWDVKVNECINTYHRSTKIKPIDIKSVIFIEFSVESNDIDPEFEANHVKIPKCRNVFAKGYIQRHWWQINISIILWKRQIKRSLKWEK